MTYAKLNSLKIELFDHLIECKEISEEIELLVIHGNTWNRLTLLTC